VKTVILVGLLLSAVPASGQPQPPILVPNAAPDQLKARHQIAVMEAVLERAVQLGAQLVGQQMQSLTPNLLLFTGQPRARGFKLDGYGVFFDVEVPALRRSVSWSIRTLNQPDAAVTTALESLRQHVQSIGDARDRSTLEQALKRVEFQLGPVPPAPSAGNQNASPSLAAASSPVVTNSDPGEAYTNEVKQALIDAMLDHSGPIAIGPDEWLTVAAQDNDDRLTPGEISEAVTIILRIRGSDLVGFRSDRISRDEARKRVEVREF
jgi:hypothetical protein